MGWFPMARHTVLYLADQGSFAFDAARAAVDFVCAGDSLTGWNDFGPADSWPYRTYPQFLVCRWGCGSPMAALRARSATTGLSKCGIILPFS